MEREQLESLIKLTNFPVISMYPIANQYWKSANTPWWLMLTYWGPVVIGWRKRVVELRWEDTPVRMIVTHDDVTRNDTMVHAWDLDKLVTYMTVLAIEFKQHPAVINTGTPLMLRSTEHPFVYSFLNQGVTLGGMGFEGRLTWDELEAMLRLKWQDASSRFLGPNMAPTTVRFDPDGLSMHWNNVINPKDA
jgi:hypothetical protein